MSHGWPRLYSSLTTPLNFECCAGGCTSLALAINGLMLETVWRCYEYHGLWALCVLQTKLETHHRCGNNQGVSDICHLGYRQLAYARQITFYIFVAETCRRPSTVFLANYPKRSFLDNQYFPIWHIQPQTSYWICFKKSSLAFSFWSLAKANWFELKLICVMYY